MLATAIIFVIFLLAFLILALGSQELKKEYGVKSVTEKGEEVKSIGERRIADYFSKNNINYVYEQEAKGRVLFFEYKISSPDFYLPDYDVYVEYWGLVNADDRWTRDEYVRNMKRKMAIYYQNSIKFISIYPRNLKNLDWIFRSARAREEAIKAAAQEFAEGEFQPEIAREFDQKQEFPTTIYKKFKKVTGFELPS